MAQGKGGFTQWQLGFMNSDKKFLTAETFGYQINASATSLRKKQVWTLVYGEGSDGVVYLKSHIGRYVAADKCGAIRGDAEEMEEEAKFHIEYDANGPGWALKSVKYNDYFVGTGDALNCKSKTPEYWMPKLAVHPQINLRNVNRKRYAHLVQNVGEIHCTKVTPWGDDTLVTLEFKDGKYALRVADDRYLDCSGKLVDKLDDKVFFTMELNPSAQVYGSFALKDVNGTYLSGASGSTGTLSGKAKTIGKDELFTIEKSRPQITLIAHNGRRASVKQGIDISANQDDISEKEIFQLEYVKTEKKWRVRTCDDKFWIVSEGGGVQAAGSSESPETLFEFVWNNDSSSTVGLKGSNGKFVTAKMTGHLTANVTDPTEKERFVVVLLNRPILVLKSEFGFVGFKSSDSDKIECNRGDFDVFHLEHVEGGKYAIRASNGKYLAASDDGAILANSPTAVPFSLEFHEQARFAIKAGNEKYIKGEQNGLFSACADKVDKSTLWEY
ncbi:protein singed-like [Tubulanus polymorphus]|uniref:protein singed-like n=1 Tax=Tubulanus polymorphus TaxID=672921 RepID=UPI003DA3FB8B